MSKRNYLLRKAKKDRFIIDNMNETHIQAFLERKLNKAIEKIGDGESLYTIDLGVRSYKNGMVISVCFTDFSSICHEAKTIDDHIDFAAFVKKIKL